MLFVTVFESKGSALAEGTGWADGPMTADLRRLPVIIVKGKTYGEAIDKAKLKLSKLGHKRVRLVHVAGLETKDAGLDDAFLLTTDKSK